MRARCQNYPGRLAEGWSEALAWTVEEGPAVVLATRPQAAAATGLLAAILVPPSARNRGPGPMQEPRPLCRSFSLTVQGVVADAEDVWTQRVEDPE